MLFEIEEINVRKQFSWLVVRSSNWRFTGVAGGREGISFLCRPNTYNSFLKYKKEQGYGV